MSTLPPPPKKRKNVPDAPGLTTRTTNKAVRPAEAAGLVNTRRSSEQKAADDAREPEGKAHAEQEEAEKLARVAAIEDKQHEQDLEYRQNANHPIDPRRKTYKNASPGPAPRSPSTTPNERIQGVLSADELAEIEEGNHPDANDNESDTFGPPENSSDDEGDTEDTGDNEESDSAAPQPKKRLKKGRADVRAVRQTQDGTGTPDVESSGQKRKAKDSGKGPRKAPAKKPKIGKKAGLAPGIKKTLKRDKAKAGDDGDGIVQYGGPALDDDAGEVVEREKVGKGKPKQASPIITSLVSSLSLVPRSFPLISLKSIVRIEGPAKRITQKEQRGDGTKRWKLSHIPGPARNGDIFTNDVWPNIRQNLGRVIPWDAVTNKQVQDHLDRFYGKGEMDAEADVFRGLISYRTHYWRGGFPTQAHKCIVEMVENSKKRADDGIADADDIQLHTSEGMQAYIESMLEVDGATRTKAFQWRDWDDDEAKHSGLFQSSLVLYTYAYHLALLDTLPGGRDPEEPGLGALILASQAMERELGCWKTGMYVAPGKSQKEQFSFDQWGDYDEEATATTPKRRIPRATRFVPSLRKWTVEQWEQVNATAAKYMDKKRKARSASGSVASSDIENVEQEPELIIEFS
ncbi:hypothetical protein MVEN_01633100 [Mycena venus]|uniref:Uncharacterized protein n=1 Tax=Mycena venus TaxID=2733690 RepID=A0A8H7CNX3_9AGAR|nr:hypothetical protein MVEN_01633100 [Mycena venus]